MTSPPAELRLVCEVDMPRRPDLSSVTAQVRAMSPVTTDFLVADNPIGRAAVSNLRVALEVQRAAPPSGARMTLCLNCRDRNLLGLQRDLLTAAASGITDVLCVFGDEPSAGGRASDLTVRRMLDEVRRFTASSTFEGCPPMRLGVTSGLRDLPAWKAEADFVFGQISFSTDDVCRWRDSIDPRIDVFTGVMVLRSARSAATIPGVTVPGELLAAVERDPAAGIGEACRTIETLRARGGFAGVHLITLGRHREVAARLQRTRPAPRRDQPPVTRRRATATSIAGSRPGL